MRLDTCGQLASAVVFGLGLAAQLAMNVLAALVIQPSGRRRILGLWLATGGASLSWLAPQVPLLRALMCLSGTLTWLRCIELAGMDSSPSRRWRILFVLSDSDPRTHLKAPRRWPLRSFAWMIVCSLLAAVGFALVDGSRPRDAADFLAWGQRWLGGSLLVYASFEALVTLSRCLYAGFGRYVPPFHHHPIVSRSLREFWGQRWNRMMQRWLHRHLFSPIANHRGIPLGPRRAVAATAVTFLGSAILHAWLVASAAGPEMALAMAAFFILHGMALLVEACLPLQRWPHWAGHLWTSIVFLITLPLFVEPSLQIAGLCPLPPS